MLDIIHKKYKDRYRIQFCDQNFYTQYQNTFKMWKTRFELLSNVEKLQAWVLALSCLRRPDDWFGGKRQTALQNNNHGFRHTFNLEELFFNSPVQLKNKNLAALNIFDFINHYRIKAVPDSCLRSLCHISDQSYPLLITEGEVSPEELLQLQISGRRVAALNENYRAWPHTLYAERDFLGFVIHDLIHADHFFKNPLHRDGQLGFYRLVEKILREPCTRQLLQKEKFKTGFEYIISDMNAHPLHLLQTLHSLLFQSAGDDLNAQKIWQHWVAEFNLNENEKASLLSVNSQYFMHTDALNVESFTRRLGEATHN